MSSSEIIATMQADCGYDPAAEGSVDDLIAYKDALEDAFASMLDRAEDMAATLEEKAREARWTCLAFVTRRYSGGIEECTLDVEELEALMDRHEIAIWEAARSEDHESWDEDMATARAYEEAAARIREVVSGEVVADA